MERKLLVKCLEKFGYTSRRCPLLGNVWKCCSIRYWKLLKIQIGHFGWMKSGHNLTLVINVCEEVPIFLFQAPSMDHQKCVSNFPSTWLANWQYRFLTDQSWHVLKSCYTGEGPEQGFLNCLADGLNHSLVSSVVQGSSGKAFEFVTFFGRLCLIACPSQQHYERLYSGITIFLEYWDYSRLSLNKLNWRSLLID